MLRDERWAGEEEALVRVQTPSFYKVRSQENLLKIDEKRHSDDKRDTAEHWVRELATWKNPTIQPAHIINKNINSR